MTRQWLILVTAFLLFAGAAPLFSGQAARASATRSAPQPVWNVGDWWQTKVEGPTSISDSLMGLTITFTYISVMSYQEVVGQTTIDVNGTSYSVWEIETSGQEFMNGTVSGTILLQPVTGTVQSTSTSTGRIYYRTSDLALVQVIQDMDALMTMNLTQPSPMTTTEPTQSHSETRYDPPKQEWRFPMTTGLTWMEHCVAHTDLTQTTSQGTQTGSIEETYNVQYSVGAQTSVTEHAGTFADAYPVTSSGTVRRHTHLEGAGQPIDETETETLDGTSHYSEAVANWADALWDYGGPGTAPDKPDLSVSASDVVVNRGSPVVAGENVTVKVKVFNVGQGDLGTGAEVTFYCDGAPFGPRDSAGNVLPATTTPICHGGDFAFVTVYLDTEELGLDAGQHTLRVVVDECSKIEEEDEGNNEAQTTIELRLAENRPPEIVDFGPASVAPQVREGETLPFYVEVEDPDGDLVTVRWFLDGSEAASGGMWNYTPGLDDAGAHEVEARATDDGNPPLSASYAWDVEVLNTNQPPTIASLSPATDHPAVDEGGSLELRVTATDPDGDPLSYKWYLDTLLQQGTSDRFSYEPDYKAAGEHAVLVIVSDGVLDARVQWNVTVRDVDLPMTLVSVSPQEDPSVDEGGRLVFEIAVEDPDGGIPRFVWSVDGVLQVATGGSYVYAPERGDAGTHEVRVSVSDDGEHTLDHVWRVTVRSVNRPPVPLIAAPDEGASLPEGNVTLDAGPSYDPDDDPLDFTWLVDGVVKGRGRTASVALAPGEHAIVLEVSDGLAVASASVNVTVSEPEEGGVGDDGAGGAEPSGGKEAEGSPGFGVWALAAAAVLAALFSSRRRG